MDTRCNRCDDRWVSGGLALLAGLVCHGMVVAQQRYELSVPGSGLISRAERTDQRLRIEDAGGNVTEYRRSPRHDSADGMWMGYASPAARQVIRWPVNDRGRMQIAMDSGTVPLLFRPSQMEIRLLAAAPLPARPAAAIPGAVPAAVEPRTAYRLVPGAPGMRDRALGIDGAGRLRLERTADLDDQIWHLTPLGSGLFRVHSDARGPRWSLSSRPDDAPQLVRTSESLDQLWQMLPTPGDPAQLRLVGLAGGPMPRVLTWNNAGRLAMRPRAWSPAETWVLLPVGPRWPAVFAEYRFVSREVRPNPPLPPAAVELVNGHTRELWVLLVDRLPGDAGQRIRIEAGQSVTAMLERDAGATLVETYERGFNTGAVARDEFVTPLPPAVRYDLSVYEVIAQSVAIDRTVPGGKIEDVQYAPRSIGWFELPPGPELREGPLDVYEAARSQENPGQVRRIDPAQWKPRPAEKDPVESLLDRLPKKPKPAGAR